MPKGAAEIVAQMQQALAITEPDLDTSIGSPVRKILDAEAEAIAEGYVDQYLLNYQYDIDTKTGADLDAFVELFGFSRRTAIRATGTVIFARSPTDILGHVVIPIGTQVATLDFPAVIVATVAGGSIPQNVSQVELPVRAVVGGVSGNVTAGALKQWVTPVSGVVSFTNTNALIGGTSDETDAQLRLRFKKTIFRSLAGTEQMYLGTALEDKNVSKVNVVGAAKRFREQIELINGVGTSTIQDAVYVYPESSIFGVNLLSGQILGENVHYSFNPVANPVITSLNPVTCPDGVYELEFQYVPAASRNDVVNSITNRVDVFVNGTRETPASETLVWRTNKVFNNVITDPLFVGNFLRDSSVQPTVGNFLIPYSFTPVIDPAADPSALNEITINSTVFTRDVDFYLVNDNTPNGMGTRSLSGVEWIAPINTPPNTNPPNNTTFSVTYLYNNIPIAIETALQQWRLVTQDVKVHAGQVLFLNLYIAVIYVSGGIISGINADITTAVNTAIASVDFGSVVQVSDLLQTIHNVPGVDAVRFQHSGDNAVNYGIQQVATDGVTVLQTYDDGSIPKRPIDVPLADNQIAVLNEITIRPKAENSMNSGA